MQRRNERFVERLPLAIHPALAYLAAASLSLIALVIRLAASSVLSFGFPYVMFFPAVILASFLFGLGPGIFAGLLCGFFAWYFFIGPSQGFGLSEVTLVAIGLYIFVVGTAISLVHWMQRANYHLAVERERNRALAENRELLFRELQHRVSNNLQVVAALLSSQRRAVSDETARKALEVASERIALVGRISRSLYDPNGQASGVRPFLESLTVDLLEASGRQDIAVKFDVDDGIRFEADAFVPLSLVVTEAFSNAIEHGFADAGGTITIRLHRADGASTLLEVADDGKGLPEGFSLDSANSLGLRIATTLAQQLGGHFEMMHGAAGGARALLTVPA